MPKYATIVKLAGVLGTAVASVVAFLVLSLVQSGAVDAAPERSDTVSAISAVVKTDMLVAEQDSQVELICSLAHIGPEQAAECEREKRKAAKRQQVETAVRR